jgi:hypothetical protein
VNNATVTQTLNLVSVSNGSCSNSVSGNASVSILALPTANAGVDQTVCNGSQVTLTGAGTGTYSWDNGATNATAFTASNNGTSPASTTYTLTVIGANGCTSTDQMILTVNPTPTVAGINNQELCAGSQTSAVTFSGTVSGTVYNWTNSLTSIGLAARQELEILERLLQQTARARLWFQP